MYFQIEFTSWKNAFYQVLQEGTAWEGGFILQNDQGDVKTIQIGIPWDASPIPWYRQLTPEEIFVGRKKELDTLFLAFTGRTMEENRIANLLNTSDLSAFWNLVKSFNRIIPFPRNNTSETLTHFEIVSPYLHPTFQEKVFGQGGYKGILEERVKSKHFYEFIHGDVQVTPYIMKAYGKETVMRKEIHIFDPICTREKYTSLKNEETIDLYKNVWIVNEDTISISSKLQDIPYYSVIIKHNQPESTNANYSPSELEVQIKIGLSYAKYQYLGFRYILNDPEKGDFYVKERNFEFNSRARQFSMNLRKLQVLKQFMNQIIDRTSTEIVHYKTVSISPETQSILQEVLQMIDEKITFRKLLYGE